MNDECPNCRQLTNTSFSRLVKDSCGHTKCRMCLLYEEQGCKACNNEHRIQNIGNYDCPSSKEVSNNPNNSSKGIITSEEIVLPLELVINKDSKQRINYTDYSSTDCVPAIESYHEDQAFDIRKQLYAETCATDINNHCRSPKVYIPTIETSEVININPRLDTETPDNDQKTNTLTSSVHHVNNKPVKHLDRSHISIIPGNPERYKCNICCKIFRNKKGKCYHDACITGIKPYQCKLCDRSFVKRSHFEYHERVHTGYKPFKCNLCDKAFPQQNKLNRHMYSHNKEKHFSCIKCKKSYSKQDDLKNHLAQHTGTATYPCKSCGKTFRILTNLKRHMRTHASARPHACEQCNKSFKDKSLLIRHKRTHGKDRPFSCAHCSRVFLSKSELRRHLTVHSDEKPFSCEYCHTVFRRKDNLKRHIRHHHSEDSFVEPCPVQNTLDKSIKLIKTKQIESKQKQKPKKAQKATLLSLSKSPSKASVLYLNSRDQINSRLDSMGNITPVIRVTGELSNAVPVINGPISIKQSDDKILGKKTFTYTEPIPLAEAVVLNRRIEEKLYSQNVSNHNYFFRNCTNSDGTSYPATASYMSQSPVITKTSSGNKACEGFSVEIMATTSNNVVCQNTDSVDLTKYSHIETKRCEWNTMTTRNDVDQRNLTNDLSHEIVSQIGNKKDTSNNVKQQDTSIMPNKQEQSNCVPTIKKYIMQQIKLEASKELDFKKPLETTDSPKYIKEEDLGQRKHWRRRMTEILKPNN